MKQTIPFTKDITFKTKIGEITSISLDNDLILKGEDQISGNFYIKGTYKMLETSNIEEEYSYKIPCEITISDEYDTYYAAIDIEDFYYEIIDDEILRVNIVVSIDNLQIKEKVEEERIEEKPTEERCIEEETFVKVKEDVSKQKDNYLTYKVYICKEGDTINTIVDKYNITKEELEDYNNKDEIIQGAKIIIPSSNVKL